MSSAAPAISYGGDLARDVANRLVALFLHALLRSDRTHRSRSSAPFVSCFDFILPHPPYFKFTDRQPCRQAVSTCVLTVLLVAAGKEQSIDLTVVDMDAFKTDVTTIVFITQVRRGLKLLVYEALRSAWQGGLNLLVYEASRSA